MLNCCTELQVDRVLMNGTRLLQANTMEGVVLNVLDAMRLRTLFSYMKLGRNARMVLNVSMH